ncbi:MAG TPA: aminoglycoside phosphotransferase family protein [Anaerolineae bacterium]
MDKLELIGRGRTAEIYRWGDKQALKLFLDGYPASSAQYELDIMLRISSAGLPVPYAEPDIVHIENRWGIVLERVDGPSMLRLMQMKPLRLVSLAQTMAEVHAAIHQCTIDVLPSARKSLARAITNAPHLAAEIKDAATQRLENLPDGNNLCHGDFHPDNIIMTANGPRVIDWTNAVQGNPIADVARTTMLLRAGAPVKKSRGRWLLEMLRQLLYTSYINRYKQLTSVKQASIDQWQLPILAARFSEEIPEEHEALLAWINRLLADNHTAP